jgi:hypothetical protein
MLGDLDEINVGFYLHFLWVISQIQPGPIGMIRVDSIGWDEPLLDI